MGWGKDGYSGRRCSLVPTTAPGSTVAEEKSGCSPHTMAWSISGSEAFFLWEKATPLLPTATEPRRGGVTLYKTAESCRQPLVAGEQSCEVMNLPSLPCPPPQSWIEVVGTRPATQRAISNKEAMRGACKASSLPPVPHSPTMEVMPSNQDKLVTEGTLTTPVGIWHFPYQN